MTILAEVTAELIEMFVADVRRSSAICTVVLAPVALAKRTGLPDFTAGWVLLAHCVAVLMWRARREAANRA